MINQEMVDLTKQLVRICSINSTEGEQQIGMFLEQYLRQIPYFQKHPEQVVVRELKNDALHRRNVCALLIGEKDACGDTLIFHGHTDTVGIEEYKGLKPLACSPDELKEALGRLEDLPEEVRKDLESGEYMFGRGACDMKSGDAVFLSILKTASEHPEELRGNILLSLNPVEENLHTGIIEGLDILEELKNRYHLNYLMAVNNDFICPLFPGDTAKTIYTGVVGKLLPCFYIQGKETHVGQCFEGFDAAMLAAKLTEKISLNCDFSDEYAGEYAYPPSVLKMKDLKPWYNVQTPSEAFVYFNYFVHNSSMEEILSKLLAAADETMRDMLQNINDMSRRFCARNGQRHSDYKYHCDVCTYDGLYQRAKKLGADDEEIDRILTRELQKGTDKREIPIHVIRYLLHTSKITHPIIVLYFAAPYCPHNTLQGKDEALISQIMGIAKEVTQETGEEFRFMKFFPSLSDSSYLKIDDTEESLKLLLDNFPGMESLYPLPLAQMKRLNIPAVNYGCYGKDAHKWTERVHVPYTFETLPTLIWKTITYYLK